VGDAAGVLPSLADTIVAVRRELSSALAVGHGQPVQFRAGPVELEFEIAVNYTGGGQAGVQLSVLTLEAQGTSARTATQRIKVTLQPLDPDTGQEALAAGARQEPDADASAARAAIGPPSTEYVPIECPAWAQDIEVHEVADGLVIYQAQPECVHHLNNTAAVVFELCDGKSTVPEISKQLAAAFGFTHVPAGVAENCIADLWSRGVLA
jgi:Trypsin-co-occurring domain 2/Coenzyme PQQ synthesis protein D (PqqD)